MILVDTSIWIDHLRRGHSTLVHQLQEGQVLIHDFVIGELSCGNMKNREEILSLLRELPRAILAENEEVLSLVESHHLFGRGIGWMDAHLLASACLTESKLWTLDKKLRLAALDLSCSHT